MKRPPSCSQPWHRDLRGRQPSHHLKRTRFRVRLRASPFMGSGSQGALYPAKPQRTSCWRRAHPPPRPGPGCHPTPCSELSHGAAPWWPRHTLTDVPTGPVWFRSVRVWCPQHRIGPSWRHQRPASLHTEGGRPKGAARAGPPAPQLLEGDGQAELLPRPQTPHWAWKA